MMNLIDLIHSPRANRSRQPPVSPFIKGDYILIPFIKGGLLSVYHFGKGDYILILLGGLPRSRASRNSFRLTAATYSRPAASIAARVSDMGILLAGFVKVIGQMTLISGALLSSQARTVR